jgi:hypothetical protein
MNPLGDVVLQHAVRLDRPAKAYDRWLRRIPTEFHRSVLAQGSVPDPDVWVHQRAAEPLGHLGAEGQIAEWDADPADVALVVEVSDTSYEADVEVKGRIYGSAGFPAYWVVHHKGVDEFTQPYEGGYLQRRTYPLGTAIPKRQLYYTSDDFDRVVAFYDDWTSQNGEWARGEAEGTVTFQGLDGEGVRSITISPEHDPGAQADGPVSYVLLVADG